MDPRDIFLGEISLSLVEAEVDPEYTPPRADVEAYMPVAVDLMTALNADYATSETIADVMAVTHGLYRLISTDKANALSQAIAYALLEPDDRKEQMDTDYEEIDTYYEEDDVQS